MDRNVLPEHPPTLFKQKNELPDHLRQLILIRLDAFRSTGRQTNTASIKEITHTELDPVNVINPG